MADKLGHKDNNPIRPKQPERVAIAISNSAASNTTGGPGGF